MLYTVFMETYSWYQQLVKPSWAPPSYLFGPVWSLLYIGIAVSFGTIFIMVFQKKLPWFIAVPFALNLFFNFIFTPLQFGLQSNILAAIDIVAILATLIWAMVAAYPHVAWVTYAQIPYLLWVTFATCLQFSITYLNYGK